MTQARLSCLRSCTGTTCSSRPNDEAAMGASRPFHGSSSRSSKGREGTCTEEEPRQAARMGE